MVAFQARLHASMRARTGAGKWGLSKVPLGAVTVMGRPAPALNGMSGLVSTTLMHDSVAETVDANGEFKFLRTCGQVPVKSMEMESPATVTFERTTRGSSLSP